MSVNAAAAALTFRTHWRLNPCTVTIEREGRVTRRLPAIVTQSGAMADARAKGTRAIMTRTFVVDRSGSPELLPRRGDTLTSDEKETVTRYLIGADARTPAVGYWNGNRQYLQIECRQVQGE